MSIRKSRKVAGVEIDEDFLFVKLDDGAAIYVGLDLIQLGSRREDTAVSAVVDSQRLIVNLLDGRTISTPLNWYPDLKKLSLEQFEKILNYFRRAFIGEKLTHV